MTNPNTNSKKLTPKERYEFLINARNFHYDNFNKWMTYFYVAIGALFVGYYTIASSENLYNEKIPNFDYNSNLRILKVTQNGAIRWKSYYWVYLTAALKGKYVGIEDIGNGIWKVFYRDVFLGFFNETQLRNKEKSIRLETNL